jgi:hypothetical protein
MAAEAIDLDNIAALGDSASGWVGELQADAWDAGDVGRDLHGAVVKLSITLKQLDAAEQEATRLLTDQRYDRRWAQQLINAAYEEARQAQAQYAQQLDSAPERLASTLVPRPPHVDQAHVDHLVGQYDKLLEAVSGGSTERAQAVGTLFAHALATNDTTAQHILAAPNGPLALTLARLGVDPGLLRTIITAELKKSDPGRTRKGARLYDRVNATGKDSLRGLKAVSASALLHRYQRYTGQESQGR